MKAATYVLRTFFVSFEMLIFLVAVYLYFNFESQLTKFAQSLDINQEFSKYVLLVPISLFIWILKEGKELLFSEKEHVKNLVNWPEYWHLKVHVYIALVYGVVFCLTSLIPLLRHSGIADGVGLIFFSCSSSDLI